MTPSIDVVRGLSNKCHAVIDSCVTLDQLAVAERYGALVNRRVYRERAGVWYDYRLSIANRRARIAEGLV